MKFSFGKTIILEELSPLIVVQNLIEMSFTALFAMSSSVSNRKSERNELTKVNLFLNSLSILGLIKYRLSICKLVYKTQAI